MQIFDPWAVPEKEEENGLKLDEAPRPPRSKKKPPFKIKKRKREDETAYNPWAVAPEQVPASAPSSEPEDPLGPVSGSYGLAPADTLPPPPKTEQPDASWESYGVAEADAERITPIQPLATPAVEKQELELAIRRRPPPPPARPLTTGVFNFPFYHQCLMPLVGLSFGFLAIGGLLRLLLMISQSFVE